MNSELTAARSPAPPFRKDSYPRTYRTRRGWRIALYTMSIAFVVAGIAGAIAITTHPRPGGRPVMPLAIVTGGLFGLLGALGIVDTRRSRVRLEADAIEVTSIIGTRRLERSDIGGWREFQHQGTHEIVVSRAAGSTRGPRRVRVPLIVDHDDAFRSWFESLPNLDASAEQRLIDEVTANPAYGATREERLAALARSRRIVRAANFFGGAALVWAILLRWRARVGLSLALPLPWIAVALAATAPGLYRFYDDRDDARPSFTMTLFGSLGVTGILALHEGHVVGWMPWLPVGLVAGATLSAGIALVDREARRAAPLVLLTLLALAIGASSAAAANVVFDRGAPEVHRARVLDRYIDPRREGGPTIRLGPWRDVGVATIRVPHAVYDSVRIGKDACVEWRAGALRSPWWRVVECPR